LGELRDNLQAALYNRTLLEAFDCLVSRDGLAERLVFT